MPKNVLLLVRDAHGSHMHTLAWQQFVYPYLVFDCNS